MHSSQAYTADAPTRAEVDALAGATVIEFGANWCGICAGRSPRFATRFPCTPTFGI